MQNNILEADFWAIAKYIHTPFVFECPLLYTLSNPKFYLYLPPFPTPPPLSLPHLVLAVLPGANWIPVAHLRWPRHSGHSKGTAQTQPVPLIIFNIQE